MTAPLTTFYCLDCKVETTRKRRADQPRVCFECGVKRAVASNLETHYAAVAYRERDRAARNGG